MSLRLVALRSSGPDSCFADFTMGEGNDVSTVEFHVDSRSGITTAVPRPDIFRAFQGSAEEQRQIVAAVVAFCRTQAS